MPLPLEKSLPCLLHGCCCLAPGQPEEELCIAAEPAIDGSIGEPEAPAPQLGLLSLINILNTPENMTQVILSTNPSLSLCPLRLHSQLWLPARLQAPSLCCPEPGLPSSSTVGRFNSPIRRFNSLVGRYNSPNPCWEAALGAVG